MRPPPHFASIRLERCRLSESARLARRRRHAVDDWERERMLEVERLGGELLAGDVLARHDLERTSDGCAWLVGRWRALAAELRRKGRLDGDRARCALLLAGVRPDDPLPDRRGMAWLDAIDRQAESLLHLARLRLRIADELRRLRSEARLRFDLFDEPDRAGIADEALVDTSREGVLHRRYESASESALHRSLGRLERLRSGREDGRASPVAPPKTKREFIEGEWVEMPAPRPARAPFDVQAWAAQPENAELLAVARRRQRRAEEAKAQRRAERQEMRSERRSDRPEPRPAVADETKPTIPPFPRPDLRRRVGRLPAPALRASALGLALALVSLGAGGPRRNEPSAAPTRLASREKSPSWRAGGVIPDCTEDSPVSEPVGPTSVGPKSIWGNRFWSRLMVISE